VLLVRLCWLGWRGGCRSGCSDMSLLWKECWRGRCRVGPAVCVAPVNNTGMRGCSAPSGARECVRRTCGRQGRGRRAARRQHRGGEPQRQHRGAAAAARARGRRRARQCERQTWLEGAAPARPDRATGVCTSATPYLEACRCSAAVWPMQQCHDARPLLPGCPARVTELVRPAQWRGVRSPPRGACGRASRAL